MRITPKSNERIFAQTAAFVESCLPLRPYYQEVARREIGHIAASLLAKEDYQVSDDLTYTPEMYLEFLRSINPEARDDIVFHSTKIGPALDRFFNGQEVDDELQDKVDQDKKRYREIGRGWEGVVYEITDSDHTKYAAKFGGVTFNSLRKFRLADTLENMPHLHAVDVAHGLAVMDLVKGKNFSELTLDQQCSVKDEHIKQLVAQVIELHKLGIFVDAIPDNFIYNPETGFVILDYYSSDHEDYVKEFIEQSEEFGIVNQVIALATIFSKDYRWTSSLFNQNGYDANLKSLNLLNRFFDVLENDFNDILQKIKVHPNKILFSNILRPIMNLPNHSPFKEFKERIKGLGFYEDNKDQEPYRDPVATL